MSYLHGYEPEEIERLENQANYLQDSIYEDVDFSNRKSLLEIGCGTGAQGRVILEKYSELKYTGIDISTIQINKASKVFENLELKNRSVFKQIIKNKFPSEKNQFDSAFICWVLEHAENPIQVIKETHRVLQKNAVLYATEVYNRSFFLSTITPSILQYWNRYNEFQVSSGGNPNIGIELGKILSNCGFRNISTKPIFIHVDKRDKKERLEALVYWRNLLLSAKQNLLTDNIIDQELLANFITERILVPKIFLCLAFCNSSSSPGIGFIICTPLLSSASPLSTLRNGTTRLTFHR